MEKLSHFFQIHFSSPCPPLRNSITSVLGFLKWTSLLTDTLFIYSFLPLLLILGNRYCCIFKLLNHRLQYLVCGYTHPARCSSQALQFSPLEIQFGSLIFSMSIYFLAYGIQIWSLLMSLHCDANRCQFWVGFHWLLLFSSHVFLLLYVHISPVWLQDCELDPLKD